VEPGSKAGGQFPGGDSGSFFRRRGQPAGLLKVAREIVLTSMAFYEQLSVAAFMSVLAVDAALKAALEAAGCVTARN
jgi:hypothetical protein